MDDRIEITCPRCRRVAVVQFYGPCDQCRSELRATVGGSAREVEVADYEPKTNVIPNQVATKE